ncbi:MAG: nucleotide sugar dehydrogenase [Myxococcota bacterium]
MATSQLKTRLESGEAVVGIVGLGYVGLPLMLTFGGRGFRCLGFDIDQNKVDALNSGRSYIAHISGDDVAALASAKTISATADFARAGEVDALLLCVPTPLTTHREPDMTYVAGTARTLAPHLRAGQLIVLESTTYPGTTDGLLRELLETESGLEAGKDFHLAYSPEREDPGNPNYGTQQIPKVVGGLTPACRDLAVALYRGALDEVVPVDDTRVAEMTKLFENIFRSVNIALVNELKVLCDRMEIDVWDVIRAASTKPFGFMPFYPGPGLGGHCIPIDPFYLTWKAREYELSTRFIELAGEINTAMPRYVLARLGDALNDRGVAMKGAKILVMGLAYKRDVDDTRESPAFKIIELLRERGSDVDYHDPHVPSAPRKRDYDFTLRSVQLDPETISSYDAVVIVTDHRAVDYELLVKHARLIIDTRNATASVDADKSHVLKA